MVKLLKEKLINNKGFTFLELIMALSVLTVLLILAVPIKNNLTTSIKEKMFLETLHNDVLLLQKLSMSTQEMLSIDFRTDYYTVNLKNIRPSYIRQYPNSLDISSNKIFKLSFNYKGTIRQPYTFRFKFKNKTYKYICPLGKGRCYFEQ